MPWWRTAFLLLVATVVAGQDAADDSSVVVEPAALSVVDEILAPTNSSGSEEDGAPAVGGAADPALDTIQDLLLEVPSFPKYRSDFIKNMPKEEVIVDDDVGRSITEADDGSFRTQRINHASHKSNAAILSHNPEAAGAASLLGGDSDHYYMTPCSAPKKWVVISLSEDVRDVCGV